MFVVERVEPLVVGSHEYGGSALQHAGPLFDGSILYGGNGCCRLSGEHAAVAWLPLQHLRISTICIFEKHLKDFMERMYLIPDGDEIRSVTTHRVVEVRVRRYVLKPVYVEALTGNTVFVPRRYFEWRQRGDSKSSSIMFSRTVFSTWKLRTWTWTLQS